jgi:hypothetical protein
MPLWRGGYDRKVGTASWMIHHKHLKEEDHLEYTPKTAVPMMGKEQQVGEYYQDMKSVVR